MNIEISQLYKKFGNNIVLNNINAIFKEGEINCIMGKSGSGKTTLLNILIGTISLDSGKISGLDNKKISVVFQEDRLCENLNSIKNIRLVCNKNISDEQIKKELTLVGLKESLDKPVFKLSGGMKRRVAIVRAIIYDGDIIIMDEPFKGLDETTKSNIIKYIKSNSVNKTLLIVTHDKREAEQFNTDNIINIC